MEKYIKKYCKTQDDTKDQGNNNSVPDPLFKLIRCRRWAFTFNNYTKNDYEKLIIWLKTNAKLWIVGKEVGKNTKTHHLQGYLEFNHPRTKYSILKQFPSMFIDKAKGNKEQNYLYCKKDGNFEANFDLRSFQDKLKDSLLEKYSNVTWKPWQKMVLDKIQTIR